MLYDKYDLTDADVTVRRARAGDVDELARLAVLDAAPPLRGDVLVAQVDGGLWAALSLETGAVVADPFRPTRGLCSLLELRAAQIRLAEARAGRRAVLRLRPRRAGWIGPRASNPPIGE